MHRYDTKREGCYVRSATMTIFTEEYYSIYPNLIYQSLDIQQMFSFNLLPAKKHTYVCRNDDV